jgi:hypothetical protein
VIPRHELFSAETREVHVIPSGLVITPLEVPEKPTATKSPSPYVTLLQLLAAAAALGVHVIPSVLVIIRFVPSIETATNSPLPYVTLCQEFAAAAVRPVHVIPSELVITR